MTSKMLLGVGLSAVLGLGLTMAQQRGPVNKPGAGQQGEQQDGIGGKGRRHRPRRPMPPIMKVLDADQDGTLSAQEIANATASLLTLDKNGDGQLTRDELRPPRPDRAKEGKQGKRGARRARGQGDGQGRQGGGPQGNRAGGPPDGSILMSRHDMDGDGVVTLAEFAAPLNEFFAEIDANGDGKIDEAEADDMPPPPHGPRGGPEGCPPPPPDSEDEEE